MSMSNQPYTRPTAKALLEQAKVSVRTSSAEQGGHLHELESAQWCGRQALVFDDPAKGITIATRVEIPENSPVRAIPTTSPEALTLLGTLSYALQAHDAEAKLIGGEKGLEAILLTSRLCDCEADAAKLNAQLNQLQDIAQSIEPALSTSGQTLINAVLERVRPHIGEFSKDDTRNEAIIIPTFDEEVRNRMMQG